MAFGQGFLPIIEHYPNDTFPVPPAPSLPLMVAESRL
jgi:hypothetical protein